ncbi:MAG: threonylcarbamoyl-AMP synthase [Betaproteobacteria bacterium]
MDADIAAAAARLAAGDLVAFPTETVYGLGADALCPAAVAKIFAAKHRPADHPLIVHLPLGTPLQDWARDVPPAAIRLADAFWPGPLTLVLRRHVRVPDIVTGGQDTVGLRIPSHPVALALLAAFGSGIAAPSANRYGRISPTCAEHVRAEFGTEVAMVLDAGPSRYGIESTIVDLSGGMPRLLRPGAIARSDLAAAMGLAADCLGGSGGRGPDHPRVPGSLPGHYAPRTPLLLLARASLQAHLIAAGPERDRIAIVCWSEPISSGWAWHLPDDPEGYAHGLYAALRAADAAPVDRIWVESVPDTPPWEAVHDRLARAAAGSGSTSP